MTEIKVEVIGCGTVTQQPLGGGRYIQLKAIPDSGATFIRWEKVDQLHSGSPTFSSTTVCNVNTRYTSDVVAVFSNSEVANENTDQINQHSAVIDPANYAGMKKMTENKVGIFGQLGSTLKQLVNGQLIESPRFNEEAQVINPRQMNTFHLDERSILLTKESGLIWQTNRSKEITWNEFDLIKDEIFKLKDWRLPTVNELKALVPYRDNLSLQPTFGYYWTSEKEDSGKFIGRVRVVSSSGSLGFLDPSSQMAHVRLVRTTREHYALNLTTKGSGEGKISSSTNVLHHPYGSIVTLQATASKGSKFKQWSGDIRGSNSEATIKMDGHKTVTAEFVQYFPFTVSTTGGGTVRRSMQADEYEAGSLIKLNAIPAHGHRFVQWHGDASGTDPHCTLGIDGPQSVVAVFEVLTYSLICQVTGSGKGSITPSSSAQLHPYGSIVTLHAAAETGSKFKQWSGDLCGTDVEARLTIHEAKTVTAEFVQYFPFAVSITGSGTVLRSTQADEYEAGSQVKLNAIPAHGHRFVQWLGDTTGTDPHCTLSITGPHSLVAVFEEITYSLIFQVTGSGDGVISPDIALTEYPQNSEVRLTAKPATGARFKRWRGDVPGICDAEILINVNCNKTVIAEFDQLYPLTVLVEGKGAVRRSNEANYFEVGSSVALTAIPANGYRFVKWRGDAVGADPNSTLEIDGPKSVMAVFEMLTYPLICQVTGSGKGSITPSSTAELHPHGSIVTLRAAAETGSRFKQWSGDLCGTDAEARLAIYEAKTVIAEFEQFFPFTVSTTGSGTVQRNMQADEYAAGSLVKLNAIPAHGHRFVQWLGDAIGTDPHCTLSIDGPKSVMAAFEVLTYSLICQVTGSGKGSITPSSPAELHPYGSIVTLRAAAETGSKFKQWSGDLCGTDAEARLTIHEAKTVTAEFVQVFQLTVSTQGKGLVDRSVNADEYEAGSSVTLTATPEEGYEFVQWHEAAFSTNPVCTVVMNSSCTVLAEFRPLPVFDLKVTHAGTGSGVVLPNKQAFWKGSEVELIAQAAEGCVFDGWSGDLAEGLEESRKVTVNAHLAVTATFNRVEIPEADISVAFDGTTYGDTQNGQATVFLFTVSNHSDRQIQLDIPLAGFVTLAGEEIEQTAWVKGMIDGQKGATLRAGTFRKMGLAFDRRQLTKVALGEHLHITILQSKPAQQLTFTFRCTDADKQVLTLVKAGIEPLAAAQESNQNSDGLAAQAELTARMQLLEKSLQEALSRLNAPPTAAPQPAAAPAQTLPEVLAWLCTQNSVPLAVLRQKLLPLGLMPSAVMDDVNERAFDVSGEPALDEVSGTVTVQRGVLLQVLAVW